MPALDFPSSPTNGQVYGQYVYDSTKGAWRVSADLLASATPSPTAPTNPVSGDLWFNTNDGVMFMYFNDGNTSQWVEVKSNTASGSTVAARVDALEAKPSGVVSAVPTSVAVGSGTASVSTSGRVTFSGASSVSLNGVFTSAYTNYRIVYTSLNTADYGFYFRLRTAGTDNSTAVYSQNLAWMGASASWGASYNNANNTFGGIFGHGIQRGAFEVQAPFASERTGVQFVGMGEYLVNGATEAHWSSFVHRSNTSFDGFTFYPTGGTISGQITVVGYR